MHELTDDQIKRIKETNPSSQRSYIEKEFPNSPIYVVGFRDPGFRFATVIGAFFRRYDAQKLLRSMYPGLIKFPFGTNKDGLILYNPNTTELSDIISGNIPDGVSQNFMSSRNPTRLNEEDVFDSTFNRNVTMEKVNEVYRLLNFGLY